VTVGIDDASKAVVGEVFVLDPNDRDATCFEKRVAGLILLSLKRLGVVSSVEFERQLQLVAVEVDDIAEQRVLPAELQVEHVAVSKELPGCMLSSS
jgi:hypothetical protein